jgi:hypothetical protein
MSCRTHPFESSRFSFTCSSSLAAAGVKLLWVDLRGAFYSSRAVPLWMVHSDLLSQSLEQVLPAV